MFRRAAAMLAIAWGCGGQLRAREPGAMPDGVIEAVHIDGNRAIATTLLEPALGLHEVVRSGGALDPFLLAQDTDRIRAAYLKRGYFGVRVTAQIDEAHRAVRFSVVEGVRATTQVEIAGLPPELPAARARALVALADGEPFDYDRYDAAKQPLRTLVENAGYAHAEVRAMVVPDASGAVAHARYQVRSGVRCRFGTVRITGVARPALVEAALRRLPFATGDVYSLTALDEAQVELYQLGRFSTVQVVPDRGGGPTVDVVLELSEVKRHEVHAGFGVGYEATTFEPRVRGGFSVIPAALPMLTLAADVRLADKLPNDLDTSKGEPKLRALVSAQYLDLFRPRLRGEAEVGADYQTVEAYTWIGRHVRLGLAAPLGARWLQLRVGWVLEYLTFSSPDPALKALRDPGCDPASCGTVEQALRLDQPQLRGGYQASLAADLRDNAIEPHRGVYASLPVTEGTPLAGGDLTYLQLTPELRGYVSVAGTVVAVRARVGAILGDVPVTERYYSGGASGHRGYPERRLSPIATDPDDGHTVVIGGAGLIETGIELRRQLGTLWGQPIGGNLFLDGGDVTRTASELDPWKLAWAVGPGLWSKLGGAGGLKIRVDVGYRLNRQSTDEGAFRNVELHIGVGETY